MKKPYFPAMAGDPAPLELTVFRQVRFEEVDSVGIVWHGRYPSYFEDARVALGDAYGMGYLDFVHHSVLTPIKQLHLDYLRPLIYPEEFSITAMLHFDEAARLNYEFALRDCNGELRTRGYSVQVMLDTSGELLLVPPDFLKVIQEHWRAGSLQPAPPTSTAKRQLFREMLRHSREVF